MLSGELVLSKFQQARLVDMVIEVIEMRTEMNSRFSEAADKLDELRDRMGKTASSIAEDFGEIIDYLDNH